MFPNVHRGFHNEKARRFLDEVNRDVRRSPSLERKQRRIDWLADVVGGFLIDLGESLERVPRSDP